MKKCGIIKQLIKKEKKMDKQYMEIRFKLLNSDGFDLSNIVNCIFELNNIIDPEYNKVEFYCFKYYWKNEWMKSDIIKKIQM